MAENSRYGWITGEGEPPPYLDLLGCRLVSIGNGECLFSWVPPSTLLNTAGVVQGGFVAAALDLASAVASTTIHDKDTQSASIRLDIEYFKAVRAKDAQVYSVRGVVAHHSRRWISSDGMVLDADGNTLVRGRHLIALVVKGMGA